MKRRHAPLPDVTQERRLAPEEIDRLYGLEPVIDVEKAGAGTEGTQYVLIACPYCGEPYETRIDLTGGSFEYVEDCQICCQPITLKVAVNDSAELIGVTALQLND
ncbi:MAG TPA: CPXCG motif-containing cysteine-rich protein [Steroidobacteraceae bacterium]|nr:CPXCG motif-containing cysteine-rich protein [Steroidobacteraceae bacterium]